MLVLTTNAPHHQSVKQVSTNSVAQVSQILIVNRDYVGVDNSCRCRWNPQHLHIAQQQKKHVLTLATRRYFCKSVRCSSQIWEMTDKTWNFLETWRFKFCAISIGSISRWLAKLRHTGKFVSLEKIWCAKGTIRNEISMKQTRRKMAKTWGLWTYKASFVRPIDNIIRFSELLH